MRRLKRFVAMLLVISLLPLTLASCVLREFIPDFLLSDESDSYSEMHDTFMVSVIDGANYKVTSKNPIRVGKGESAKFRIELDFGFEFVPNIPGVTYDGGVLTVSNIQKPTSVKLTLKRGDIVIPPGHDWALDIETNETHHWYSCNDAACSELLAYEPHSGGLATYYERAVCDVCGVEYGELIPIPEFETVTVKADAPAEGYRFLCWSIDLPVEEGGEVFTTESEGTFDIPFESKPVANYVDTGHHVVMYRCNGGKTADGKEFLYHTFSNKFYQMPNTIHQNGTFVREGYSLMRYNEKPDGSGKYATLGGKVEVGKTGFCELYLIWQRNTENGLKYGIRTAPDGREYVTVVEYTGISPIVTIPEKVSLSMPDGSRRTFTVEAISSFAFSGLKIESVSIPKSVTTIEENAFFECERLTELTVHDLITSATDASFKDTPVRKIYLNAARGPLTAGSPAMTALKYERLRLAASRGEKKILVISGSSSLHGFLAEEMEAAFGGEYRVINYGTNAGACAFTYLYAFMEFFGEGDIIIHAPEITSASQLGQSKISTYTFRYAESHLDIFSYLDMTHFTGFFDSLSEFNTTLRMNSDGEYKPEMSYESGSATLNEYCDMINNPQAENYKTASPAGVDLYKLSRIKEEYTTNMNLINSMLVDRGATMYYSFAPFCSAAIHPNSATADARDAFVYKMQSMIDYKIISDPLDYQLEEYLFNNSDYHPGRPGASIRTQQLISDLKAVLAEKEEQGND